MFKSVSDGNVEAGVRGMYADGVPVERICRHYKICRDRLYSILDHGSGGPVPRRRPLPVPSRNARAPLDSARMAAAYRSSVVTRLWRVADRQVRDIGRRLSGTGQPPTDIERDARALATLARTVRELAAVDPSGRRAARLVVQEDADDHDAPPRDPELFRAALAQRIDQLRETGSAAPRPGGPERD